uniref:Uncharacterized protein n=1 Tax=viral metagenome TaxID=1070528 RepID=A0A6C0BPT6_9ZZZZ
MEKVLEIWTTTRGDVWKTKLSKREALQTCQVGYKGHACRRPAFAKGVMISVFRAYPGGGGGGGDNRYVCRGCYHHIQRNIQQHGEYRVRVKK